MNYLFVLLAVLCITMQFSLTKVYQKRYVRGVSTLLFFSMVLAAVGMIFFLCLAAFRVRFGAFTFIMAFLNAFVGVAVVLLGIAAVRLGRFSIYMLFLMLGGMLLPFVYGTAFLSEMPTPAGIAGMAILTASLFVPFIRFKRGAGEPVGRLFVFLCVCVFILNGCGGIIGKAYQMNTAALGTEQFLIWHNISMLILSAAAFGVCRLCPRAKTKELSAADRVVSASGATPAVSRGFKGKTLLLATLLAAAAALFACGQSFLMLRSAKNLPASVLFPMVTGGVIVLSAVSGLIFFKEKLTLRMIVSLALTLVGTILFLF